MHRANTAQIAGPKIEEDDKRAIRTGSIKETRRASTTENTTRRNSVKVSKDAELVPDPSKPNRKQSRNIALSPCSINQIFKELKVEPYIQRRFQELNEDDPDRRLEFCESWQDRLLVDPQFPQKVIWSGEATFHVNGSVNTHNCEYISDENFQDTTISPGLTVWGALWNEDIVGPMFFDKPLTSENYIELLNNTVFPYIVNQMNAQQLLYQMDGAPSHLGSHVRDVLNDNLPLKWIGRRGATLEWPPRSPDLTPIGYFLWSYLKNKVYIRKIRKMEDLKIRVKEEFTKIKSNKQLIKRITASVNSRVLECINNNGSRFKI